MSNNNQIFAINRDEVMAIVEARHDNPHHILGMHQCLKDLYVNVFAPDVAQVFVVDIANGDEYETEEIVSGFYTVKISGRKPFDYEIKTVCTTFDEAGDLVERARVFKDPYAFPYSVDPAKVVDIISGRTSFADGFKVKDIFGVRYITLNGVSGTSFCMEVKGARRVSVVGDFNNWDASVHQLRKIDYTDIFELFIPEVIKDSKYKFSVLFYDGREELWADPYAICYEKAPGNASMLTEFSYEYHDDEFVKARKKNKESLNIYEIHMSTFIRNEDGSVPGYAEFAGLACDHVADMGYNYVELMPVMEYREGDTWGYDTTGMFAPSSRFGTPVDFMRMIDVFHKKNIGVILDMVPVSDIDCICYWLETYHLDGVRLNDKNLAAKLKESLKNSDSYVIIDSLESELVDRLVSYMAVPPVHRGSFTECIGDCTCNMKEDTGIIALSHDDVAFDKGSFIDKLPGGYEDKYADLRVLYGLAMTLKGHKLFFMGQELGAFGGFDGVNPVDWSVLEFDANTYIQKYVKELNKLYASEPALKADSDIVFADKDEGRTAVFARTCGADRLYVACNFDTKDVKNFGLRVDKAGSYKEIFSSDNVKFGGEGNNNKGTKKAADGVVTVTLPALSISVFKAVK